MAAMICSTCGQAAITTNKETIHSSNGKIEGVRFTMHFPCGHQGDKWKVNPIEDGRRNTKRF